MIECGLQKVDYPELARQIKAWALEAGFAGARIGRASLPEAAGEALKSWLADGCHGQMDYMARHGTLRLDPAGLVPGALSVVSLRMDYWPDARDAHAVLADGEAAYVSRYALGRDYHKVLRKRLQALASRIEGEVGAYGYRVFTDSAPLAEVSFAAQAGLGWRGKHTLLLNRDAGSLFFLGEIVTDLPLPEDAAEEGHCGRCTRCIDVCPTGAIVAPYRVDARLCISYLTIELPGAIPEALRPRLGNRVYGCDDCQLSCPWNRFARLSGEGDFAVRHGLDAASLAELFAWSEADFRERTAGSPIWRIGYQRWLRNLAVGLGNAPATPAVLAALAARRNDASALVREHVEWALARHDADAR